MAETNLIHGIYINATAGTAIPTLPAKNANYSQATLSGASWETIGSRKLFSHDADLDEDTIDAGLTRVYEIIKAPRNMGAEDHIPLEIGPSDFEFVCYDQASNLYTLDSNIVVSNSIASQTATTTKRAVIIEIEKLAVIYYPSCVIGVTTSTGGFASGGVERTTIQVMPEQTTAVPGGWRRYWKIAA